MMRLLLVALLASTATALKLTVEHHGEGHPDHKERGALYRFTLDNYDQENRSKGRKNNCVVCVHCPVELCVQMTCSDVRWR